MFAEDYELGIMQRCFMVFRYLKISGRADTRINHQNHSNVKIMFSRYVLTRRIILRVKQRLGIFKCELDSGNRGKTK